MFLNCAFGVQIRTPGGAKKKTKTQYFQHYNYKSDQNNVLIFIALDVSYYPTTF